MMRMVMVAPSSMSVMTVLGLDIGWDIRFWTREWMKVLV